MTDKTKELGNFAFELCGAENYDAAFSAFDQLLTSVGFDSVLYSHIPSIVLSGTSASQPVFSTSESYDSRYMMQYMEAGFYKDDHVISSINDGRMSHIDWWKEAETKAVSKGAMEVFSVARDDFKMTNGFTIPTLTGSQGIAAASFISSDAREPFDQLLQENEQLMIASTKIFHNHVMNQSYFFGKFLEPSLPKLNATQRAVFKGLLLGLTTPVIAGQICKNPRYVENVVRDLRVKIGGSDIEGKPLISKDSLIHYGGLMRFLDQLS
jgi:hypothetical protein